MAQSSNLFLSLQGITAGLTYGAFGQAGFGTGSGLTSYYLSSVAQSSNLFLSLQDVAALGALLAFGLTSGGTGSLNSLQNFFLVLAGGHVGYFRLFGLFTGLCNNSPEVTQLSVRGNDSAGLQTQICIGLPGLFCFIKYFKGSPGNLTVITNDLRCSVEKVTFVAFASVHLNVGVIKYDGAYSPNTVSRACAFINKVRVLNGNTILCIGRTGAPLSGSNNTTVLGAAVDSNIRVLNGNLVVIDDNSGGGRAVSVFQIQGGILDDQFAAVGLLSPDGGAGTKRGNETQRTGAGNGTGTVVTNRKFVTGRGRFDNIGAFQGHYYIEISSTVRVCTNSKQSRLSNGRSVVNVLKENLQNIVGLVIEELHIIVSGFFINLNQLSIHGLDVDGIGSGHTTRVNSLLTITLNGNLGHGIFRKCSDRQQTDEHYQNDCQC